MEPNQTKKTLSFEINGKHYDHIDEVPPEYREKVLDLMRLDDRWKNSMTVKVTYVGPSALPELPAGEPDGSHREKFLRETVLPNLHLMDPKAQAEILRELGGDKEKRSPLRKMIFWAILYAALVFLILFGYSAMKNMFVAR